MYITESRNWPHSAVACKGTQQLSILFCVKKAEADMGYVVTLKRGSWHSIAYTLQITVVCSKGQETTIFATCMHCPLAGTGNTCAARMQLCGAMGIRLPTCIA